MALSGGAAPGEGAGAREPFVESPAGSLFFLNAVLAAPAALALLTTVLRGVLRGVGALEGPSRMFDPVPEVAAYVGPAIAWLSVVPLWLTVRNLRMPLPAPARWSLRVFLALHVGVLAWWAVALTGR